MRYFFDTEFIEDGVTIDLISIGIVSEDGREYYAEFHFDRALASEWVRENVFPHLMDKPRDRYSTRREIVEFVGEKPEFWAYYADYDWVALCQLFGTMMDLPAGWPMYCRDVKQLCDDLGNPQLPKQTSTEHHALADARWTRDAWLYLRAQRSRSAVSDGVNTESEKP